MKLKEFNGKIKDMVIGEVGLPGTGLILTNFTVREGGYFHKQIKAYRTGKDKFSCYVFTVNSYGSSDEVEVEKDNSEMCEAVNYCLEHKGSIDFMIGHN